MPGKPRSPLRVEVLSKIDTAGLELIVRSAGSGGRVGITSHFKMRAAQRGFTTLEALNVLRRGTVISQADFCAEFCNWKMVLASAHDRGSLNIVVAVGAGDQGQVWSKSVVLVTGFIR